MTHTILAARTDFSVGESILTADQLVEEAKRVNATVLGVTDTMSVTAMLDVTAGAKKAGLKPVIGTRLRLVDDPFWRPGEGEKKKHMPRSYFVTVYPKTEAGMKIIYRLLSVANDEDHFYYETKLGIGELHAALTPDLAVVLGDGASILEHPDVESIVGAWKSRGAEIWAPLVPIDTPYWGACNRIAIGLCADHGLQPLVIRPTLYLAGEADGQEVMKVIADNARMQDPWRTERHNRDMQAMTPAELTDACRAAIGHLQKRGLNSAGMWFSTGLRNTGTFVDGIAYEWAKQPISLPTMAPDEFAQVMRSCKDGLRARFGASVFGHKPTLEEIERLYKPRLAYELTVLRDLGFSGYFLLVQDIVAFAKKNNIRVGPGRGSVGGSLVAYLMGITDCDPIRFGLLFERFINPERIDLPDADLDFMSTRRHEIVNYLVGKFGRGRVAGVSNFSTLGASSTIRDVCKAFGLPETVYNCSKFVPKRHGQPVSLAEACKEVSEIGALAAAHPELWQVMLRLEGLNRNLGQHAAGLVVGGCDLNERAVIERRKEGSVVNWDKRQVEDQGLVKVDVLGLKTLDLIEHALDYVRERKGRAPDILAIPLDDPEVLKRFAEGRTTAVFQFESAGMRRLLREIAATGTITFDEIAAATALYRPGPMESGLMDSYYKRKRGDEPIDYMHPLMEPILKETFGVIVYQEQVMKISQVIAGYTGPQADKLRKIMGKKLPEEMAKERDRFVQGCIATVGAEQAWAEHLFDVIEGFAGYGFNKSHAVEYTLISYQSMWLKVHYGVEFFAAALTILDSDKLPGIIRDAASFGIEVDMPDINNSTDRFEILTDARLSIPFQRIKGLSSKTTEAILTARKGGRFSSKQDFIDRVERRRCNVGHQDKLDKVGAFAFIEPGQLHPKHPERKRDQVDLLPGLVTGMVSLGRDMETGRAAKLAILGLVKEYRAAHGPTSATPDGSPVKPSFGKAARLMVISDCPGNEEDESGTMGLAKAQQAVWTAIYDAGLDAPDVYWTALVKRPKRERQVTPAEIAVYAPYLEREISILKPTVVVLLGSQTVRHFLPEFRGRASEEAGKVIFDKARDLNFVIGFNPGEIYHDPDKQLAMNRVFEVAAEGIN